MTRVGRNHHNNFEPRTPNYSYTNSDQVSVSGESIVASSLYGFPITRKNVNCPTNTQSLPKVDTSGLIINTSRRIFFEDQYHWVNDRFDESIWDTVKYLGSGTLSSDEVSSYLSPDVNGLVGQPQFGRYEKQYQDWDAAYGSWLNEYKLRCGSKSASGNIHTLGRNTLMTVENLGNMVDRWVYKVRETDRNEDSVVIVHDGSDYGRQAFGDIQILESLRLLKAFLGGIGYPVSGDIYYSGVDFVPPLPLAYHNPITAAGVDVYAGELNQPNADCYYPEYWHQSFMQKTGFPYYSNITTDETNNTMTIETCFYTIDFSAELRGGDAISGAASVNALWDPVTGFQETLINSTERGYVPLRAIQNNGYKIYNKKEINYGGEGVHREVFGFYQSSPFSWRNYLKSDLYEGAVKLSDELKTHALEFIGTVLEANHANSGYHTTNILAGGWLDPRFNQMHYYSPETKETTSFSSIIVSAAIGTDGIERYIYDEDNPVRFTCSPVTPTSGNAQSAMTFTRVNGDESNDNNRMIISQYVASGSDGRVKYQTSITPSDTGYINSNKIMSILERTVDNPGGLSSVAIGRYAVLDTDKDLDVSNGWQSFNTVNVNVGNHLTSGNPLTGSFGNALQELYSSGTWGSKGDTLGNKLNTSPGSVSTQYFVSNNNSYVPAGWSVKQILLIVGEDKDDVINKLETYLSSNTFEEIIYPEDELPASILNYHHPLKAGNIY